MVRCSIENSNIPCQYRRHGDCEGAQEECPHDVVARLFEEGKSIEYIADATNLSELEIDDILEALNLK